MKKHLGENIRYLRKLRGLNQTFLGQHLHKGHTTIGNWEKGLSEPNLLELREIASFFEIPVGDLLEKDLSGDEVPTVAEKNTPLVTEEKALIETHTQQTYLVPEFAYAGADTLIRIEETSMAPLYNAGDILACKHVEELRFIQWGKVYVLQTAQGRIVRRLFENPNAAERVICHSGNAVDFPPFDLPYDAIQSAAIVVGAVIVR